MRRERDFVKSLKEINERIRAGCAVVVTAEELIARVELDGVARTAREVDVVTTATFAPMCSSGVIINFGHTEPPIRMTEITLNDVPAYGGLASVDTYLGATAETEESRARRYGGAHVIADLVQGRPVKLVAKSSGTDCYPRTSYEAFVTLADLAQACLHNPRNAYQNYAAAANTSETTMRTYMGTLLPECGNVTYCSAGELSPLLKDPYLRSIGVGTRIFLGGGVGYVTWEGTQHNTDRQRLGNGIPLLPAATLTVTGDLKTMQGRYLQPAFFHGYGATLYVGIGIPLPMLDETAVLAAAIKNDAIFTEIRDFSVPSRNRPSLGRVSYAELRSGSVGLQGRQVPTVGYSCLNRAAEIATVLGDWIRTGRFTLTEPVRPLAGSSTQGDDRMSHVATQ